MALETFDRKKKTKIGMATPARQRNIKLTEDEKALVIESYRLGHSPSIIAGILKKEPTQITTFYSRWKLISTLPPKVIVKKNIISGRFGLKLKDLVLNNPKLSSRKLARKLKDEVPGQER